MIEPFVIERPKTFSDPATCPVAATARDDTLRKALVELERISPLFDSIYCHSEIDVGQAPRYDRTRPIDVYISCGEVVVRTATHLFTIDACWLEPILEKQLQFEGDKLDLFADAIILLMRTHIPAAFNRLATFAFPSIYSRIENIAIVTDDRADRGERETYDVRAATPYNRLSSSREGKPENLLTPEEVDAWGQAPGLVLFNWRAGARMKLSLSPIEVWLDTRAAAVDALKAARHLPIV